MTYDIKSTTVDVPLQPHSHSAWDPRLDAIARQAGQDTDLIVDLIAPVLLTTDDRLAGTDIHRDPIVGPAVRWAVLHGFTATMIADLFGLPQSKVDRFVTGPHCPTAAAQRTVALVKGGRSVTEVRRELGLTGKGWLYRTLDHARVETNPFGERAATTTEQRAKAVRLYKGGHTYKQIADDTGMTLDNVKNTLRAAHKRGDLPEYGNRR